LQLTSTACPLCREDAHFYASAPGGKNYLKCPECALIFLHPYHRLSPAAERARYELHQNESSDADYVGFLRRLANPLMERLAPGARGLDFGCGPAPVLAGIFTTAGFPCAAYDPFFAPDATLLEERYDYVACSEVIEHLYDPASTFETLRRLLGPGGKLGVMTRSPPDEHAFADWWYRRDPTHVCFYSKDTLRWIGERHGWNTEFPREDVTIFAAG
jgi:SAM-dependent methyltransferase